MIYARIRMTKNKGDYCRGKGFKKKYKVNNKRVEFIRYGEDRQPKEISDMGITDVIRFLRTEGKSLNEEALRGVLHRVFELTSGIEVVRSQKELGDLTALVKLSNYVVLPTDKQVEVLEADLNYFVSALKSKFASRFLHFGLTLECTYSVMRNYTLDLELAWGKVYMKFSDSKTQDSLFEFVDGKVINYTSDRLLECFMGIDDLIATFVDEMGDGFDDQVGE